MNTWQVAAATLTLVIGAIHSVLGELLIFRRLRTHGVVPTADGVPLHPRHVRIVWASWHLVTVFGWALALLLLHWSAKDTAPSATAMHIVSCAMVVGALLVGIATRGRHPGWAGMLVVALLVWVGGSP